MREAAVPNYRLNKCKPSLKVLITLAVCGLLMGLFSAVALTLYKTGISPQSVREYYLGSAVAEGDMNGILADTAPRPIMELLEITHMHLVGGSMLLFMLCHLISLCEIKDSLRTAIYVASFGSFLLSFGMPWLIIGVSSGFSYVFAPVILIFMFCLLVLCLIPLKEMW